MGRSSAGVMAMLLVIAVFATSCQGSSIVDIAEPGSANAAAWAMAGGSSLRQGRTALSGPTAGQLNWAFNLDGDIDYPPALAPDGTVYLAQGAVLSAFSPAGEEQWRFDTGSKIIAPPFYTAEGTVQVVTLGLDYYLNPPPSWQNTSQSRTTSGSSDSRLIFINPDGTENRSFNLEGYNAILAVIAADSRVFMITYGTGSFNLAAADTDGTELWRRTLDSDSYCSRMALTGNYITFVQDGILRFYQDSGDQCFIYGELSSSTDNHLAPAADGRVYLVNDYDLGDGEQSYIRALTPMGYDTWSLPFDPPTVDAGMLVGPDGVLYASDQDETLYAVASNGNVRWTYPEAGTVIGVAPDGNVYLDSYDFTTQQAALNIVSPDGELVASIAGFPHLEDNSFHIAHYLPQQRMIFREDGAFLIFSEMDQDDEFYDFGLHAVDSDGTVLWSRPSSWSSCCGHVVDAQGNSYACTSDILYAVDAAGQLRWSRSSHGSFYNPPVLLPDGNILTIDRLHEVSSYTPTGELAWRIDVGGWGTTGLAAAGESRVYLASRYSLHCLDLAGNLVYFYAAENDITGGPAISADGTAYFIDRRGLCYAVDRAGQEKWRFDTEDSDYWIYPVVTGANTVLFPAENGLTAVDTAGTELWRFAVDGAFVRTYTPALAADGTIYLPVTSRPTTNSDTTYWLYALHASGEEYWCLALERAMATQPLVDGTGAIYIRQANVDEDILIISPAGEIVHGIDSDGSTSDGLISGGTYGTSSPNPMSIAPGGRLVIGGSGCVFSLGP